MRRGPPRTFRPRELPRPPFDRRFPARRLSAGEGDPQRNLLQSLHAGLLVLVAGPQFQRWVRRRFVGRIQAGEPGEAPGARLPVQSFRIALLADFARGVDVDFDEGNAARGNAAPPRRGPPRRVKSTRRSPPAPPPRGPAPGRRRAGCSRGGPRAKSPGPRSVRVAGDAVATPEF